MGELRHFNSDLKKNDMVEVLNDGIGRTGYELMRSPWLGLVESWDTHQIWCAAICLMPSGYKHLAWAEDSRIYCPEGKLW